MSENKKNFFTLDTRLQEIHKTSSVPGKSHLLTDRTLDCFRAMVYDFYRDHGRDFPWRRDRSPYSIFISEVMLQQTRTETVAARFPRFLEAFPGFMELARSPLEEILREWKGLGYNRRARNLQRSARMIVDEHNGLLPEDPAELVTLPGIGPATAASIAVYAFDRPEVFIETNIRSLFIYVFFPGEEDVHDRDIYPLVEQTLDRESPARWYSALMDIGVYVKSVSGNPSRKSRHFTRQKPFEGSRRQVRSRILEYLLDNPGSDMDTVERVLPASEHDPRSVMDDLCKEGMVKENGKRYYIS
jgi:A/G-specific adenine glycosylase